MFSDVVLKTWVLVSRRLNSQDSKCWSLCFGLGLGLGLDDASLWSVFSAVVA